jgi:integrase
MKARIKDLPPGVGVGKAVSGRGKEYWRVRLGKKFTGGSVVLKDFSKLEEARKWIFGGAHNEKATPGAMIELKQKAGMVAFELSAAELHESAGALKELEKAGMTLTEAIQFAIRHAKPPAGVLSVAKAIEAALAEKGKSKRPTYLADLGKRWRRFERWLPAENHMTENPCLGMTVEESTTKKSAVRILSIEEARKLLHLVAVGFKVEAEEREKSSWRGKFGALSLTVPPMDMVPIIAVGCFGGVRPEESARMTWDMVDFKRTHIDLPAEITKDGDRRIVDMPDNLIEWLLPCRKECGLLYPVNFRRKRWALCRAMAWKEWPDDILRHSYGSYHLAKHRNAALTAEQMGHKNARMLYAHYREVVKEVSAIDEYWKLTPELSAKVIRLNVAA